MGHDGAWAVGFTISGLAMGFRCFSMDKCNMVKFSKTNVTCFVSTKQHNQF
jgi:hypothetical protein